MAWIDFNGDNDFDDDNENIFSAQSSSLVSGVITIPSDVVQRKTRMRIAMSPDGVPPSNRGFANGESEDYTVYVVQSLSFIKIQYGAAYGYFQDYGWINKVELGAIVNQSNEGKCYSDFLRYSTNCKMSTTYQIKLTPGFPQGQTNDAYWKVWIDYNCNGSFEDEGENVYTGHGTSMVSGNFTAPLSFPYYEKTRMRVFMSVYEYPYSSTSGMENGEVEDYTVNLTQ